MRVHCFEHAEFEGPGSIEPWLRAQGHAFTRTRLYAGEPTPAADALDWLVVMGGPMNVYQHRDHPWLPAEKAAIRAAIGAGKRVLGICLGAQLVADALGARVMQNPETEIGWFAVRPTAAARDSALVGDWTAEFDALHWHGDNFELPAGSRHLATSAACANQAFEYGDRVLALQFHLELGEQDAATLCAADPPIPGPPRSSSSLRGVEVPGPYVQAPAAIVAEPARFAANRRRMAAVLERLAAI